MQPWLAGAGVALAMHAIALAIVLHRAPPPPLPKPEALALAIDLLAPEASPPTLPATADEPVPPVAPPPPPPRRLVAPPSASLPPPPLPPTPRWPMPSDEPRPTEPSAPAPARSLALPEEVGSESAPTPVPVPAEPGEDASPAPRGAPPTRRELDYFARLSAHLNRRKTYPAEAKQARQQGVVVVRFRIGRDGRVLSADIKRGSGHPLLDAATLDLLHRVSPLPRIPRSIDRDELTLSLPIDYALTTE